MAKEFKLNSLDTFGKQSSVIKVDTMTYIPYDEAKIISGREKVTELLSNR